jgi:hypothetical protein
MNVMSGPQRDLMQERDPPVRTPGVRALDVPGRAARPDEARSIIRNDPDGIVIEPDDRLFPQSGK